MPLNIDFVQVLLHLLNFVILAGGLTLLVYKPVRKFLDERRARFEALAEQNLAAKEESERLIQAYARRHDEAEAEIAELKAQAERESAEAARVYLDQAKEKAAAILANAEAEAETRRAQILDSAQTEIGELVIGAAQKLLTDTADAKRTAELYDAFLSQAEANAAERNAK